MDVLSFVHRQFAAAFPLAPLLAVLNNVVEIRTDAIKILNTNNKPYYKGAEVCAIDVWGGCIVESDARWWLQDIGGWYGILELVGYIAVVTNTLLIVTGFSVLPVIVNGGLAEMHPVTILVCCDKKKRSVFFYF